MIPATAKPNKARPIKIVQREFKTNPEAPAIPYTKVEAMSNGLRPMRSTN